MTLAKNAKQRKEGSGISLSLPSGMHCLIESEGRMLRVTVSNAVQVCNCCQTFLNGSRSPIFCSASRVLTMRTHAKSATVETKGFHQNQDVNCNIGNQCKRPDYNPHFHNFSTALRNVGTGADFVGLACPCAAQMQATSRGVDPASPANLHEAPASTRPPFARYEFCEKCGLSENQRNFRPQKAQKTQKRGEEETTDFTDEHG